MATSTAPPTFGTSRKFKPVILCVDDVRQVLDTLEEQLYPVLGKRFSFEFATSGDEALELIDELLRKGKEIAVIVADVVMIGMRGDELLIRAHKVVPNTLKIMLTGQANTEDVTNVINEAKLYRYIAKPWDITDMQLTIEEAGQKYLQDVTVEEQNRTLLLLHETAQSISSKRDLSEVYAELLPQLLTFSGAEKAAFIQYKEEEARVQAIAMRDEPIRELDELPLAEVAEELPAGLIQQVISSREKLVFAHAANDPTAQQDPYVAKEQVRSLFIEPFQVQGRVIGIIYLEHKTQQDLFTPDRLDVLDILGSQAAIAIDNAFIYEHLEREVLKRTKQLMALSSQKDEMIRIVSHEIRSPLSGIINVAEILSDKEIASDPAEVMRYGDLMKKSTTRVLKLADDILDLAQIEAGEIILNKQPLDLAEFLPRLLESYRPQALPKDLKLAFEAKAQATVHADELKLSSAIGNLLSNAIKFTPKGGTIQLTLATTGGQATIQVKDSGIGIPADQQAKLFQKFGAKQRSGTGGERGTGLGLSIVRELVEAHGGTVSVESAPEQGSTFTVLLPLHAA